MRFSVHRGAPPEPEEVKLAEAGFGPLVQRIEIDVELHRDGDDWWSCGAITVPVDTYDAIMVELRRKLEAP